MYLTYEAELPRMTLMAATLNDEPHASPKLGPGTDNHLPEVMLRIERLIRGTFKTVVKKRRNACTLATDYVSSTEGL